MANESCMNQTKAKRTFHLSVADQLPEPQNPQNKKYPSVITITNVQDLDLVARYDHCAGKFLNNERSTASFRWTDCIMMDVDNDDAEDSTAWKTVESVQMAFPGVILYATYSRNHMKEKRGKAPRPKFHLYFPLSEAITDGNKVRQLKETMLRVFPSFDPNAKDSARFFFGVTAPRAEFHDGEVCIDTWLEAQHLEPESEKPRSTPPRSQSYSYDSDWEKVCLLDALDHIPINDMEDAEWYYIGCALHYEGLQCSDWEYWSSKDTRDSSDGKPRYRPGECERRWAKMNDNVPRPKTGGYIRQLASERYGWTAPPRPRPEPPPAPTDADAPPERGTEMPVGAATTKQDSRGRSVVPEVFDLDEVPPDKVHWLYEPYILRGALNMLQGDPGIGKTSFSCAVAAGVSTGTPLYQTPLEGDAGDAIMMCTEDSVGLIAGKLRENSADGKRVHLVKNAWEFGFTSPAIEEMVRHYNAALIVFDPFQAFLGAKTDMHRANEVRPIMNQLADMAARLDVAVVIVSHLGKARQDKDPVLQSLGSTDIPGIMRSILHVTADPMRKDVAVAVHVKASYSKKGQSLAYTMGGQFGGIEWLGYSSMTKADIGRRPPEPRAMSYEEDPIAILIQHLADEQISDGYLWTYVAVEAEAKDLLNEVPYKDSKDLRKCITALSADLKEKAGLVVEVGARSGNARGIRIRHIHAEPTAEIVEMAKQETIDGV